ncbi:hypothetical protein [Streptomyces sp. HB2AG]|uniref:hypothetical protein n=1 Tax=Streptomyces sp. HB2AG TaxID=2983400 RepID=UPI0022AAAD02|nr:hypothetical protein [Streptomyces sp. HB2AG]MCZ2527329.1 hypothetical protein [Streptomyces sp. HB2AG]
MTDEALAPEDGEHFVQTAQEIGSWKVVMLWPLDSEGGGPRSIQIEPTEGADSQEVARGITTTVLRKVDIAAAAQQAAEFKPWAQLAREATRGPQKQDIERFRQGLAALPAGLSDEYLAVISNLYVRFVEAGQRAPVAEMETWTGTKQPTLKGHLRAARQRGFLTKVEGKAGGRLTEKAIRILEGVKDGEGSQEV